MIYKFNLEEREHNLPRVMEDIRVEVGMAMKFVEDMVGVGVPKIAREMIADTVIQTNSTPFSSKCNAILGKKATITAPQNQRRRFKNQSPA